MELRYLQFGGKKKLQKKVYREGHMWEDVPTVIEGEYLVSTVDVFIATEEIIRAPNGLYKVYWKSGGSSLAAKGCDYRGVGWLAPTNWTFDPTEESHGPILRLDGGSCDMIKKIELIEK